MAKDEDVSDNAKLVYQITEVNLNEPKLFGLIQLLCLKGRKLI